MLRTFAMGIAAAATAVMLASPASAGGFERGYDYYGGYKDPAPAPYYPAPAYPSSSVTVYQAAPVLVPAPTIYAYPVYTYGIANNCGCKRWRKRWRRGCW